MRKIVIGAAAAATLLAAWFAPDQDGGVVGPAGATTRDAAPAAVIAGPPIDVATEAGPPPAPGVDLQIHPRVADDEMGNVFAKQSWAPQAPLKVMQEEVPQARQAAAQSGPPALPFQFMGRFTDEGKTAYFLQIDGQNVVARPGEKVNDSYLLDSVSGDTMNFIYLPLNQKQTLVVGDTN
ncbi:hypothetical protein ACEN9F_15185 [Duganella sp. CT11-25]|uniref:hypothetical protein n=1 Tax=unclassified Duganella TaxID=2636909 RepID=UPI0039AEF6B4